MEYLQLGKRLALVALKGSPVARNRLGKSLLLLFVLLLGGLAGCGEAKKNCKSASARASKSEMRQVALASLNFDDGETPLPSMSEPGEVAAVGKKPAKDMESGKAIKPATQRKIIYTATLDLVVEDFSPIPAKVGELANRFDGYIAGSDISGSAGLQRNGSWKIRVPVDRDEKFLDAARGLGELRSEGCDSEDVSDEFYDLTSRIRNKQKEETRLIKLLEDATGKLEEVLKVEKELSRVRGEIERMQGRIRVINDLTAMTTVNLSVEEVKDYVPLTAPGYTTRVGRAFRNSVHGLKLFGQAVSIAIVALTPWAVVLLPPVIVIWVVARRRMRMK